jgi:hypothetical protein
MMTDTPAHWRFFRSSGFDQVRLDSAAELLNIGQLDQKLWVALACPVHGLEFDARTLQLIDSDGDGFVRAPELIAAVQWAGQRLQDVEVLAQSLEGLPLQAIAQGDEPAARLYACAQEVLALQPPGTQLVLTEAIEQARRQRQQVALANWQARAEAVQVVGEASAAAYESLLAVRQKVDDWFTRCQLARFDGRAAEALNTRSEALDALSSQDLSTATTAVMALPLAAVHAQAELPLMAGLNPAWQARMDAFVQTVLEPMLGPRQTLSAPDWQAVQQAWQAYADWLAEKPEANEPVPDLDDLERLVRYVRDLMTLANNFVAFRNFYARQGAATFQAGTLYMDGRACELCVALNDAAKHVSLAGLSNLFLAYLDCVRGAEKRSVVAAFTAGDADLLMVGRNGVFYDRQGRDWNATIVRLVQQPISLRQAFWSPYRRAARLVFEQLQKMAANKATASSVQLSQSVMNAATGDKPAKSAAASAFDVGKFAGIFAAIGLALGALGTAVAATLTGLLGLRWWQWPLVLVGLLLLVSGPSMVVAWFKLRSRNLGPLLDANGWAVNSRARINIAFGTALTQRAVLPEGAERSLVDPYADKPTPWGLYAGLAGASLLLLYWLI